MTGDFEKLAYEEAVRGLDKQEGLLEALRTRTGVLMAASFLAASLLGQRAAEDPGPRGPAISALVAFVISMGAGVFILLPNKNLVFAATGSRVYEGLYPVRKDIGEVYRRLTYDLQAFWESNEKEMLWLSRAFTVAAGALVAEILSLTVLIGGSFFQ
jgi:hypothetical protein